MFPLDARLTQKKSAIKRIAMKIVQVEKALEKCYNLYMNDCFEK